MSEGLKNPVWHIAVRYNNRFIGNYESDIPPYEMFDECGRYVRIAIIEDFEPICRHVNREDICEISMKVADLKFMHGWDNHLYLDFNNTTENKKNLASFKKMLK